MQLTEQSCFVANRASIDGLDNGRMKERGTSSMDYFEQRMTSSEALAEMEEAEAAERELEEVLLHFSLPVP